MGDKAILVAPVSPVPWTRWMDRANRADRAVRALDSEAMARLDDDGAPASDDPDGEAPTGRFVGADVAGERAWDDLPDARRTQLRDLMTRLGEAAVRLRPGAGHDDD
jgi:hypothetical protein